MPPNCYQRFFNKLHIRFEYFYFRLEVGSRTEAGQRGGVSWRAILCTRRTITFATVLLGRKLYCSWGLLPKTKVYWRYNLNPVLSRLLNNQTVTKGENANTANLLELGGMTMAAYVTQVFLHDRPDTQGYPVLLRGDNVEALSWINRCGPGHITDELHWL